jgi:flagellar protein FliS
MDESSQNPYLRDAVLTATPEQLHLMLYDGAIRNATQAREAILRKDYETSYEKLTRAQHILLEMHKGLNFEVNAELCGRMASIYNFLYRKLLDANIHRDVQEIDNALRVLRIERETWQMLVDKVNRIRQEQGVDAFDAAVQAPPTCERRDAGPVPGSPAHAGLSIEG